MNDVSANMEENMKKNKTSFQDFDVFFWGSAVLWVMLAIMFIECVSMVAEDWFGTENGKTETLKFIGFGMDGILATIGAVAINRRAYTETENNKLIEREHIDERFKSAIENLGNKEASVRIASFHQFYYLAEKQLEKQSEKNIKNSEKVFLIFCAHICAPCPTTNLI